MLAPDHFCAMLLALALASTSPNLDPQPLKNSQSLHYNAVLLKLATDSVYSIKLKLHLICCSFRPSCLLNIPLALCFLMQTFMYQAHLISLYPKSLGVPT
jgi:hypothetical protein